MTSNYQKYLKILNKSNEDQSNDLTHPNPQ